MEVLIWVLLIAGSAFLIWKYTRVDADVNKDGKVDGADAKAAVEKVTEALDTNKDGKVTAADAKVAVEETVKKAKASAKKATDVNKDGKITAADAKVVAKKTTKKVAEKVEAAVKKPGRPKKPA